MIVPAPPSSFFPPPPWSQTPLDGRQQLDSSHPDFPPAKKQRISEIERSIPLQNTPLNPRLPPPSNNNNNPPVMKGISRMFFKTRICEKFLQGTCPYGSNCNFAHGVDDIRKPPPNWKEIVAAHGGGGDDRDRGLGNLVEHQKVINRLRICRKFYYGEGCPYGDKCTFLHEDPEKVRESAVGMVSSNGNWLDHSDSDVVMNHHVQESRSSDGIVISVTDNKQSSVVVVNSACDGKPVYWKTKICNKWEMTGHCPFGEKCHFAHGHGDLQKFAGGHMEVDSGNVGVAPPKPLPVSTSFISPVKTGATCKHPSRAMRLAKLNGPGMISHVYADWIDNLELS
ncbi:CCCH-type zinc finger protein [Cinnamomum micranthum f. kanehirae]|uniref:CCCH-type zinc finger protein n=1 Tax=Cinnamomum micranthum f. kanehirae TaxID=337451 RepID=A0A443NX42_9MAGN|nr:CCCH-type zinc finger protein [Cinnamomum micranthum f. kanehirae]